MIVGSIHLYSTRRVGPFGQTKDTEDLARLELAGQTPLEVLRSLRVLVDTLEQQMSEQEEAKKDNPVEPKKPTTRGRRAHLIEDDEDEEDEDPEG